MKFWSSVGDDAACEPFLVMVLLFDIQKNEIHFPAKTRFFHFQHDSSAAPCLVLSSLVDISLEVRSKGN